MLASRRWCLVAVLLAGACATPVDVGDTGVDVGARDAGADVGSAGDSARVDAPHADAGSSCATPDADHDGHNAIACGGDDCDDHDPNRFPGNPEVCDARGHDEDCNPLTFGTTDVDHDGYVSNACFNTDAMGVRHGGDDCDDSNPSVHPTAPEVCNGIDDDCDGAIDEGVQVRVYPDLDHDGYGTGGGVLGCAGRADTAPLGGDCDDTRASVHPGAIEVCNGIDDDCDTIIDEMATCAPVAPAAASACMAGACVTTACASGLHVCAGACASNGALASCGLTSCAPCAPPAHSSATCDGTSCVFACDVGYVVVGAACDVPPPRQIAPLSTATVTSRTPTLRWALAAGTNGARVDICRDRACSSIVTTIDATGASATPTSDLPTGVLFWRLHGRTEAFAGTLLSPTWEFTVGARSAAVQSSWGTTLDVNGDGYPDLAVGAPGVFSFRGRTYVYLGSRTGLATSPATTLTGPDGANGEFGHSVASAGDVNGDGYADLAVGASRAPMGAGRAYVYLGGPAGIGTTPNTSLSGSEPFDNFGNSVASAGDVNGDGYADLAVGAENTSGSTGRTYVYLGSATGLVTSPATTLTGPDGAAGGFGYSVASAGDVNGDGYADLAVGAFGVLSNTGRTYVYLGAPAGLVTSPATTLTGPDGLSGIFGYSVASAGDVNGDGYADLAVGAYGASSYLGRTYVYLGSATGLGASPATTLTGPDGTNGYFGISVASAGDVNGDGYSDLAVGAFGASSATGRTYVYLGSPAGLAPSPGATLTGPDGANGSFGVSVASAGDVNGDGYSDLAVGAFGVSSRTGRAYVFLGSPARLGASPATTLSGPDGAGGNFGLSVY